MGRLILWLTDGKTFTVSKGFSLRSRSFAAVLLAAALLVVGFVTPLPVKADELPIVNLYYGTLSEDLTLTSDNVYVINGTITIPDGIKVTVEAGTVIKNAAWNGSGFEVQSGGVLDVDGTSAEPIVYTSYRDDSVAGDTNGDGSSTVAAVGDYTSGMMINSGGTADIDHMTIRYGQYSVISSCGSGGSLTVHDSNIGSTVDLYSCQADQYTFSRNQFNVSSGYGIRTFGSDLSGIDLDGTDKNVFTGDGQGAVVYAQSNSYVASGKTWDVTGESGAVLVSAQIKVQGEMNLKDGLVMKAVTQSAYYSLEVFDGGELNILGNTDDPVVITSTSDDSHGGDSNGDGSSVGSLTQYGVAINADSGSHVDIEHASIRYGTFSIGVGCTAQDTGILAVSDSQIYSTVQLNNCPAQSTSFKRNRFMAEYKNAIEANHSDLSGLELEGADQNIGVGAGEGVVVLAQSSSFVPVGNSWSVSGSSGVTVVAKDIDVNGTLNIEDGALIKIDPWVSYSPIEVNDGGVLNVAGTTTNPVVFTSLKDDSVGGDTNGDGASTRGITDYTTAIGFYGGSELHITHALFHGGTYSLAGNCQNNPSTSAVIEDNDIYSTLWIEACGSDTFTIRRNQFAAESGNAMYIRTSELSGISLAGSNKNMGTGTPRGSMISVQGATSVASGKTWHIESASNMAVEDQQIEVDGNLVLDAGVAFKARANSYIPLRIKESGTLVVNGTQNDPVVFTSAYDDAAYGDTNGDGVSSPQQNEPGYAIVADSNSGIDLDSATIKYAGTGVDLNAGAYNFEDVEISYANTGINVVNAVLAFRGKFSNINDRAMKACNQQEASVCAVDAAYVDWGSANGPFGATSSDNLACGTVSVVPWVYGGDSYDSAVFSDIKDCSNFFSMADAIYADADDFKDSVDPYEVDCSYLIQDACDQVTTAFACTQSAIDIVTSFYSMPSMGLGNGDDVSGLGDALKEAVTNYLISKTAENIFGEPSRNGIGFTDIFSIYQSLESAFDTCAP